MSTITVPRSMPTVFQDCQSLHHAMKGLGCNEKHVIDILAHRNFVQRRELVSAFRNMYGKELVHRLEKELHSNLEKAVVMWMLEAAERDAVCLRNSMKGLGTRDKTLTEIICSRTASQLYYIKQIYQNKFHASLDNDVNSETSGDYSKLLLAYLTSQRPEGAQVDMSLADDDARELYRAGEGRVGTDEATFIRVFTSRSVPQLTAAFAAYRKLYGRDFDKAIKNETSGDFEKALRVIFKVLTRPAEYYAEVVYSAMKGPGTNDSELIRVVVSRAEIDMQHIRAEFTRLYNKSLEAVISDETSGHYKEFLLALVGA